MLKYVSDENMVYFLEVFATLHISGLFKKIRSKKIYKEGNDIGVAFIQNVCCFYS